MSEMDWELVDRYLSGEASSEDRERVEAWLAEDPEHWAQFAALREALTKSALSESAVEEAKAEVWARLEREVRRAAGVGAGALGRRLRGAPRNFAPASRRPWFTRLPLAAALFLVVIGGSALGMLLFRSGSPVPEEAMRVVTTPPGQRARFRLPDGTQVVLGVASTLRYPSDFSRALRRVSLQGEGYFEVAHDHRRAFVVRAADLIAQDLGTEFTVRAYPEDAGARVVVREGRVAIRAAASAMGAAERVVAPGQLGRLGGHGEPTVELADTAAWFAWTEGRLVFANTPLREAVRQIERWRDVEIHLAPPDIGERQFTTSFGDESTSAILGVIGTGLHLDVVQTGSRTYTLRPK
ncbi:MAG: FecR domain-containing protein [Gemmatimonadales bacterium]